MQSGLLPALYTDFLICRAAYILAPAGVSENAVSDCCTCYILYFAIRKLLVSPRSGGHNIPGFRTISRERIRKLPVMFPAGGGEHLKLKVQDIVAPAPRGPQYPGFSDSPAYLKS